MDRTKSYLYKKKTGVDGVDKRVLRAHQKTVEQKSRRDEAVQMIRNIQPDPSETIKKAATKDQAISRKEMLAKWKEERDLKRKLEAKDKKKPGFKVVKVDHQDSDVFCKSSAKSTASATVTVAGKKDAKHTKKQQTTTQGAISTTKPEVSRRQTRSSTAMPPSTRVTRNNKTKPVPQTKNTKKGKENAPETSRRTSSKTTSGKAKESSSGTDSESSGSGVCLFNSKTVRIGRGDPGIPSKSGSESESFAPMDFTFTAPATVKPFVLKPVSPTSAVRFFSGTDSSEEEHVPTFQSPAAGKNTSIARSPVESSFQPVSFYGNKENKTPAASSKSRQSIRRSLAVSSTSASETEAEVAMSAKGRKKSIANEKSCDSPRKSSRRSHAPKSGAGEKEEDVSGACETSGRPTPSTSRRRKSVRASLAASSASASESEAEVPRKGRKKSLAAEKPVDSPRKSVRRSRAPTTGAGEKGEEINGAVKEDTMMEVAESQIGAGVTSEAGPSEKTECGVLKNVPTPTAPVPCEGITSASKDIDNFSKTPVPLFRSTKKTQRITCRTLAKLKSPEERVEVLSRSPMIEMTRRTPKTKSPVDHYLPTFDDSDFLGPPPPMASMDEPEDMPVEPVLDQQPESTPQEEPCASTNSEPKHDVKYFRALLVSETDRLNGLSATWDEINETTDGLNEDVKGQIRTTSGQAQLLISQRFKQFRGLVDDCEFNTGLKPVDCSDLQGFWDMVYFQVEDVNDKFDKLEKLKASGWVMDKPKVKKVLKKKTTATVKPAVKITARSKFADFRAKMKQPKPEEQPATLKVDLTKPVTPKVDKTKPITPKRPTTPEVAERNSDALKTFEGGFFQIASPVLVVPLTPTSTTPKITVTTTPSQRRSLVKTAVVNSARRSGGIATEMPKSAKKARQSLGIPSPLLPGCMAERRTPQSSHSAASPLLAPRSTPSLRENTPNISGTAIQKTSSTTPALEALRLDDSISGDDQKEASSPRKTPAGRSSVRKTPKADKSVKFSSDEMDVDEDFVSKYCMPTIKESTSKPVMMEVDPFEQEVKDEEMPGQMKRDLKDEFDKHSKSAEKTTKGRSVTSALKTAKKTPAANRRRSVRFVQSPSVNEEMAAPLPRTPFNRDSCTVPQRRRSSRLSSSSSMGSCAGRVSTPRPTKPYSEDLLMLDSPLTSTDGQAKVVGSLLFTPAESSSAAPPGSDLICFSPVVTGQTPKRRKVEPVRRRSTRTASRSEENLL